MSYYTYKAINDEGRYTNGKISAENIADLTTILRQSGLELVSCKEEKQKSIGFLSGVTQSDLVSIFIHLEQLERAGVSIVDSIADLKETADSAKVKSLMQEVYESIKNGNLFSESLARRPDIFSKTYIALISMGEKTGNLSNAFASIIEDIKWNMDIKRKTKKAVRGPLFGIIMIFIVMGVMASVVVPKVTGFLLTQGMELPLMTICLIKFSNFFKGNWYLIVLFWPALWALIKFLNRYPEAAFKIDAIKLKIPVIGPVISKIEAAKFCQFFAMTFKSGLGILECIDAAGNVVKNNSIKRGLLMVKQQVSDGKSLAGSIAETNNFPGMVVRMFKIGEESGNMDGALQNIKFFYDREINDSIDRLVGMIQPTLTIFMGGMIAWITIAVFGPIYGNFSKIQ